MGAALRETADRSLSVISPPPPRVVRQITRPLTRGQRRRLPHIAGWWPRPCHDGIGPHTAHRTTAIPGSHTVRLVPTRPTPMQPERPTRSELRRGCRDQVDLAERERHATLCRAELRQQKAVMAGQSRTDSHGVRLHLEPYSLSRVTNQHWSCHRYVNKQMRAFAPDIVCTALA